MIRASSYRWRPKAKRVSQENPVHLFAVQLLKFSGVPGLIYFHTANEGKRSERTGAFLKRMGFLPGVADLTIIRPGGLAYFLELKAPKGRLSEDQRAFRDLCEANGTPYAVAASSAEVESILGKWGCLRTPTPVQKAA